jgi:osmotically inducible lipoprotein OsmB
MRYVMYPSSHPMKDSIASTSRRSPLATDLRQVHTPLRERPLPVSGAVAIVRNPTVTVPASISSKEMELIFMDTRRAERSIDTRPITQSKFARACRYFAAAGTLAAALSLAGCYGPPTERDALVGGAVGAGGGALVGSAVGSPGVGAVVGGLAGAGTGYLIGNHQEEEYWRHGGY